MESLHKQIRRAQRRLVLQAFGGRLAWCWLVTLLIAAGFIAVNRWWPRVDDTAWAAGCLGGALAGGLLAAAAWTWAAHHSALDTAVEIDRRFGLKDRVASSLSLEADQQETAIGRALVDDAAARLSRIDVAERFRVSPGRRALLPLAPAALAALVFLFVAAPSPESPAKAAASAGEQANKPAQVLVKRLDEKRKQAAEKGLAEADPFLKDLETAAKKLAENKSPAERQQALLELNELGKQADKKRQELSRGADLKQQLNGLKNMQAGPAEKLGQALKNGDLQKAIAELDKLKDQLAGDKLDAEAKEQLARQVEQLKAAADKHLEAQKQAQQELKKQIDAERRAGNKQAADKLQEKLDKLAERQAQNEKLAKMAEQLKQAADCMQQGDCQQAAAALGELGEHLSAMEREEQQLETIDIAMEQLADCKNAMACKECQGQGCEACRNAGEKIGQHGARQGGLKPGVGRGGHVPPEDKAKADFFDSRVKQQVGKGSAVVAGLADGANRRGQALEQIKSEFSADRQESEEVLSGQRLPHDYRDHAKKYFDALREGGR